MKVCLAGHGAFGIKHLEAMSKIPGIEVVSLVGSNLQSAREFAQQWNIPHWTDKLAESLAHPGLEAVILATPTQLHAARELAQRYPWINVQDLAAGADTPDGEGWFDGYALLRALRAATSKPNTGLNQISMKKVGRRIV